VVVVDFAGCVVVGLIVVVVAGATVVVVTGFSVVVVVGVIFLGGRVALGGTTTGTTFPLLSIGKPVLGSTPTALPRRGVVVGVGGVVVVGVVVAAITDPFLVVRIL
jgi:hypothetical protein